MIDIGYDFDKVKSALLREQRGFGFEEMVALIEAGHVVLTKAHANQNRHAGQSVFYVDVSGYVWMVPHEERNGRIRLITFFPSRKATKQFLKDKDNEK